MNTKPITVKTQGTSNVLETLEKYATSINALVHARWFSNKTATFVRQTMTHEINPESCLVQFGLYNVYSTKIAREAITAVVNFNAESREFIVVMIHRMTYETYVSTSQYVKEELGQNFFKATEVLTGFDVMLLNCFGQENQRIIVRPKMFVMRGKDEIGCLEEEQRVLTPVSSSPNWWFLHQEPRD